MGAAASQPQAVQDHEVASFLNNVGLQVYSERMVQSGFDDLETLLAIEDRDMKALGFTQQHAALLKKKLQEHQGIVLDENHPVVAFLREAGLAQYAEGMLKNGWDDMETLAEIDDEGMKELAIPRGHVLKLKKRLREYQEKHATPAWQPPLAFHSCDLPSRASSAATTSSAVTASTALPSRTSSSASSAASSATSGALDCWEAGRSGHSATASHHMVPAIPQSWEQVQQVGVAVVAHQLYTNTVKLAPDVIDVFRGEDGVIQAETLQCVFAKFVKYVGCTVAGEFTTQRLLKTLRKLRTLTSASGFSDAQWKVLGRMLDITLHQTLGDAVYTSEVQRAWMTAYSFMSSIMIDGFGIANTSPGDIASSSEGES